MLRSKLKTAALALALLNGLFFSGCSSDGYSGDDDGEASESPTGNSGAVASEGDGEKLTTHCGVVADGTLLNPVATGDGVLATFSSVVDSNVIIAEVDGGLRLIKLHGIGDTIGFDNTAAKALIPQLFSAPVYYFSTGCQATVVGGGEAEIGQLVTASGVSFSEKLIEEGVAGRIETSGACQEAAVSSCFSTLVKEVAAPEEPDAPAAPSDTPKRQASNFLWKPDSESAYNPGGVSILTNPCGVRVLVDGQEIRDYGGTNGRCITARAAGSGCSFGSNIKVELIDEDTGDPVYFGNDPHIIIANGCDRVEYAGDPSGGGSSPSEPGSIACTTAPSTVQYRAVSEECGGVAAVILSGEFASAFSVQLRLPDGGDRLDEACGESFCSPYKVQRYIDGAGTKTACFGAPGDAVVMANVVHTSIKMAGNDSNPDRFCIPNPAADVN